MADIRINALATTAASTASDDYIAIDGSANGTRKLNAYSPTFGGDLTVSGTGANTFGTTGKTVIQQVGASGALTAGGWLYGLDEGLNLAPNGAGLNKKLVLAYFDGSSYRSALEFSNVSSGTATLKLSDYGGPTTIGGNLTVSGGSIVNGSSTSVLYFGTPSNNYLYYDGSSLFCRIGGTDRLTIPSGTGNVLIGGTIDGGQKLQVSGTANFSSGSSANTLSLISTDSTAYSATAYNSAYRLWLYGNGATSAYNFIRFSGGGSNEAAFGTVQNASGRAEFVWQTFDGSAYGERLRIASGGDATFAGTVKASTLTASQSVLTLGTAGGGGGDNIYFSYASNAASRTWNLVSDITAFGDFAIRQSTTQSGSTYANALYFDASRNATFAGSIAINNTVQTAAAVASTHKVTISIGGSTYYLLATNV